MASALFGNAVRGLGVGSISYGICRGFSHSHPFEKAVLVTVLVGFRILADASIKYIRNDKAGQQPRSSFLISSAYLLAIPFALYAGRVFKFKEADYLQILGLTSLGYTITSGLKKLNDMRKGK